MLLPAHGYLFDVIEDPLQFIEADVTTMMPIISLQILLDLVVLFEPQPTVGMLRNSSN
jgi:hypothetical protein